MDEKLKATIQKIKVLAAQNPEFESEMKKIFGSREVWLIIHRMKLASRE